MLRRVPAFYQFISLLIYLYYIFFGQTFKVEDSNNALVTLRRSKEILQTKYTRFKLLMYLAVPSKVQRFCNRSSGNSVSWPADLVVQGSIPTLGENLLKSKLVYIAHSLSLSSTHRPDMIETQLKRK